MKKIYVAGLQKQSFVDYPGAVSCVIFLAGCNMRCHYCHNSQLFDLNENKIPFDEVLTYLEKNKKMLDSVVISGGEPTLNKNLPEIITAVKKLGLKIKLDTNGTDFETVKDFVTRGLVDYVALDVKAPLGRYKDITGYENIGEIYKTAQFLKSAGADYMFRTTLSPMLKEADIKEMGFDIVKGAKIWQLQQFVPNDFSSSQPIVYLPHTPVQIAVFAEIAKNYAQQVVVRGL